MLVYSDASNLLEILQCLLDSRLDELWVVFDFELVPDLEESLTCSDEPILQYSRVENNLM